MNVHDKLYERWRNRARRRVAPDWIARAWQGAPRKPSHICSTLRRMGAEITSHRKGQRVTSYELLGGPDTLGRPQRLTRVKAAYS